MQTPKAASDHFLRVILPLYVAKTFARLLTSNAPKHRNVSGAVLALLTLAAACVSR